MTTSPDTRPNAGKSFQAYTGIGPQDPGCPGRDEHDFDEGRTTGRCMTAYECKACGVRKYVDSSD